MYTTKLLAAATLIAAPALAQDVATTIATDPAPATVSTDTIAKPESAAASKRALMQKKQAVQFYRFNDQRGINVFESPKVAGIPFTGFRLDFGAAFTQQFQGLGHSNTADSVPPATGNLVDRNRLMDMGHGFPNAVANLYLDAQLAKGIRVAMTSYLSARHHNETWVKDGYFLIDDTPLDVPLLAKLFEVATVKAGHYEINYGDAHFRRTDNGQAMYNPLVGNLLMDAFTTSIGTEVYLRKYGFVGMAGITNGEVKGAVTAPGKRSPAFLGKLGWDGQVTPDLRVRLTGSAFTQTRSANQTLYTGDRAGSRYYNVIENSVATEKDQAWSGNFRPDFNEMHAQVINPFLKYRGLEYFGNIERATGRSAAEQKAEADVRKVTHTAHELTYRLLDDQVYVSGRTNTAKGRMSATIANDVEMKRNQVGAGWFITPTVLLKGEWVNQTFDGFATTDIRNGAKFKGFVLEGVVAF